MQVRKRLMAAAVAALVVSALTPTTAGAATNGNRCWEYKSWERSFATKINRARSSRNRTKLRLDPELSKVARAHTHAMARKQDLFHSSSANLRNRITNWTMLGENVGYGGDVQSLHRAFMDSPAHRANVLNGSFVHVGVGVVNKNGVMYVTMVYEARTDPGTTLSMPRC